jgi:hypothetical protein
MQEKIEATSQSLPLVRRERRHNELEVCQWNPYTSLHLDNIELKPL